MSQENLTIVRVYRNGRPAKGVRVALGFSGFLSGGVTRPVYTDKNGVAEIFHSSTGKATLYVDGKEYYDHCRVPDQFLVYL